MTSININYDADALDTQLSADAITRLVNANRPQIRPDGAIWTGAVRLSWPALAEPTAPKNSPGAVKKYAGTFLFPHKEIAVIRDKMLAMVRDNFPHLRNRPEAMLDPFSEKVSLRDQALGVLPSDGGRGGVNLKQSNRGYRVGYPMIVAKGIKQPTMYRRAADIGNNSIVAVLNEDIERYFYPGAWVIGVLNAFPVTQGSNTGVFLGLNSLFHLAHDKRFGGGRTVSASEFADVETIEDPNASAAAEASPWD